MGRTRRTNVRFEEELPRLLTERGLSLRGLAAAVGVGPDHLSRVLRGARGKRATPDLIRRTSDALDLPEDYFAEVRLALVIERLENDPSLLDRVYDRLRRL